MHVYLDKHFKIRSDQEKALKLLPGKESDHIRNAIDDYLEKVRRSKAQINVSMSPSAFKHG